MPTALVRIFTDKEGAERLADIAEAVLDLGEVSLSTNELPDEVTWTVDVFSGPNEAPEDFLESLKAAFGEAIAGLTIETEVIEDANWVAQSLAGLDPVFAGRFVVHGAHDRARVPGNAYGIQVEAALAFGTGHHGTTKGCLLAFDRMLKTFRPERVLDLGTGTGVLAIAAAKALRQPVLATDIDATSVLIARENAEINGVATRVRVVEANGLKHPEVLEAAPYDLIFANILAGPLVHLAPHISQAVMPGARVILSGLMNRQERLIRATYHAHGFLVDHALRINGWSTLTLIAR